jgi:hypothetical protein
MLSAPEKCNRHCPPSVIGEWVERAMHEALAERAARVAESSPDAGPPMIVRDVIHAIRSIPPERPVESCTSERAVSAKSRPRQARHHPSRL